MAKTKVLQLITRSDWTGAQKVLYAIAFSIKKYYADKFVVEVACGPENGMLMQELNKIGVKVHVIDHLFREISFSNDFKAYFEIKKLIERNKYDVIHTHSSKAGILGRIAAKRCGVENVLHTYHGFWGIEQYRSLKKRALIWAERVASRHADYLVFLGRKDMDKARNWRLGDQSKYRIIPNAIIPESSVQKGCLRRELNIPENVKIIGNVARLDPPKNPFRFLRVAEEVLKEKDDVVFVWIGGCIVDDTYGLEIEKFLKVRPYLRKKVFFFPFRKDAIKLMADFDVFLLTSDSEGMPLVILEALSQGVPVVSMNVGCVGEMIEEPYLAKGEEELKEKVVLMLDGDIKSPQKSVDLLAFLRAYIELYDRRQRV